MIEFLQYKNGKSIVNQKATPRSGGNYGSAFPSQVYASTFSPSSNKSGKRVRNSAWSPTIISKEIYGISQQRYLSPCSLLFNVHRKKSANRKNSTSRKRVSLGGNKNQSKLCDDITMYTSNNKAWLVSFNNKSNKKKRGSCKKKKKREYYEHPHATSSYSINTSTHMLGDQKFQSRTGDNKSSWALKKPEHKRTMTIVNDQFASSKNNISFNKKVREKAIFKILSSKKFAKKIVPTIQPQTERSSSNIGMFMPGRSTSGDTQMYTISSLNNRAHLIATQRDMFYPNTLNTKQEE